MSRFNAMWQRAFDAAFLRWRSQGYTEDTSIMLAERDANEGLDRYVDEKIEERKLGDQ